MQFSNSPQPSRKWYVAGTLGVEVTSQGHSIDEALANLGKALELYFEDEALP